MRFLIAGMGSAGRRHLRNLVALGERDLVLYRTGRSTLPDDELADFPAAADLEGALEFRPDAVIIANPTALHLEVALPAVRAGCHLLIEKPVSHSMERIDELEAAVKEAGVHVLVGFQYRFHPGLQALRRWVREGIAGPALYVSAHYGDYLPQWHPWENHRESYSARADLGGGALLTLCHPIDTLLWIFGDPELRWAVARTVPHLGIEVEGIADLALEFPPDILAGIHVNYVQQPPVHRIEVVARDGTLRWDQADGRAQWLRPGDGPSQTSDLPAGFDRNALFLEETRHFLALMRGETESACSLQEGLRSLTVVLKARSLAGIASPTGAPR